ncbi:MAG: bifunctional glutamate N-acetyltransferase/amino-acid acetyltransferase ArgJ [Dehalococcoidia bacterium]|nr:bifunctional glutamate N-acetyltransferase/amino-acid acetyltransferase ArgJ [Dehalococcoidia bacterium]
MNTLFNFDPYGSVTTPQGFVAGAAYAGINSHSLFNLDVAMLCSEVPSHGVGIFTTNQIKAASVLLCQKILPSTSVRGIIVNSGCANASTGEAGQADAQSMGAAAAAKAGVNMADMLVASTGVIGRRLPLELLNNAIEKIILSPNGGDSFAQAILTTDTKTKQCAVSCDEFCIGGVAKGAGMIHPNMATMLSFLTTDATVEISFLQKCLRMAADKSFNMISVDGDTSPNDSLIMLANGMSENNQINEGSSQAMLFQQALESVCVYLAKELARDGEGATRLIEMSVFGARNQEDASKVVHTVISSPLVKTAIHGCDPNWGRIVVAAGRSGASLEESKLDLSISGIMVMREGMPLPFDKQQLGHELKQDEVHINMNLNLGDSSATGWGCDLSKEYVCINADYTT